MTGHEVDSSSDPTPPHYRPGAAVNDYYRHIVQKESYMPAAPCATLSPRKNKRMKSSNSQAVGNTEIPSMAEAWRYFETFCADNPEAMSTTNYILRPDLGGSIMLKVLAWDFITYWLVEILANVPAYVVLNCGAYFPDSKPKDSVKPFLTILLGYGVRHIIKGDNRGKDLPRNQSLESAFEHTEHFTTFVKPFVEFVTARLGHPDYPLDVDDVLGQQITFQNCGRRAKHGIWSFEYMQTRPLPSDRDKHFGKGRYIKFEEAIMRWEKEFYKPNWPFLTTDKQMDHEFWTKTVTKGASWKMQSKPPSYLPSTLAPSAQQQQDQNKAYSTHNI